MATRTVNFRHMCISIALVISSLFRYRSIKETPPGVKSTRKLIVMHHRAQPVIFTDLDGTLLDHAAYSFAPARDALHVVKEQGIPIILCSSKTRAEIEYWRTRLDNSHPFISENGGAIFIPDSYFTAEQLDSWATTTKRKGAYRVIPLGTPYPLLRKAFTDLQKDGFSIRGFGDMSISEVARVTGLDREQARLATQREYDETFLFTGSKEELNRLHSSISAMGLRYTQGRFHHLLGDSDKGKAVKILEEIMRNKYGVAVTIALGDSPNDIPMLATVDYPVLVQNYQGIHDPCIDMVGLIRADGVGPAGWSKAVITILRELGRE